MQKLATGNYLQPYLTIQRPVWVIFQAVGLLQRGALLPSLSQNRHKLRFFYSYRLPSSSVVCALSLENKTRQVRVGLRLHAKTMGKQVKDKVVEVWHTNLEQYSSVFPACFSPSWIIFREIPKYNIWKLLTDLTFLIVWIKNVVLDKHHCEN